MDYVIAIRTYNREEIFGRFTLKVLLEHGLTHKMTVFVGSDIAAYRALYPELNYVQAPVGAHKAVEAICNYYPRDTPILFLDDDIHGYFEIDTSGNKISGDLNAAIEKGFSLGRAPFQFSSVTNRYWMKARPLVSKRYAGLVGYAFGALNEPELINTLYGGHTEESYRTVQYLKRGIIPNVLNHCALWTKGWGVTPGGFQSNGRKIEETKLETENVAAACEGWVSAPLFNDKHQFWQLRVLPSITLKKRIQGLTLEL